MREGFDFPFGDADTPRHIIPALGDADAARLLDIQAPDLSNNLRSRFLREAAGNPLALVELPRGLQAEDDREASWLPLTARLERTFSSRLSDLPQYHSNTAVHRRGKRRNFPLRNHARRRSAARRDYRS